MVPYNLGRLKKSEILDLDQQPSIFEFPKIDIPESARKKKKKLTYQTPSDPVIKQNDGDEVTLVTLASTSMAGMTLESLALLPIPLLY